MQTDDLVRIREETNVSALLSLQHDDCQAYWAIDYASLEDKASELGLTLSRCPIRDFDIADMRRQLPLAVAKLAMLQNQGHRTYVHCTAGLGRAPLVVLTYLVLVEAQDPEAAIALILANRPNAVPAWEAYHGCRHDLVEANRAAIERRAYELYRQGLNNNAHTDWQQAQLEVLRHEILNPIKLTTDN